MGSLGDRIKRYEQVSNPYLPINTPCFIRVDGKSFHSYTRGMGRPFDYELIDAMVEAARWTASEMMGFKLGYVQSDEATFMLTDYDSHQTEPWFGYEVNKLVSITASMFTAFFNREMSPHTEKTAIFDARAFSVPVEDAPNVFVWRQRDWQRNSLQMLSRAHFTHKELHGVNKQGMHDLLHSKGVNWADLDRQLKNGTFITRGLSLSHADWKYEKIAEEICP